MTCTRTTSSPIDGDGSLLITKDAANRQGEGCTIQFTIDSAYKAKVLQIEFDYIVASGTFTAGSSSADSDLIAYIYDVTNSTLIEPSSIKLLSNSTTIADHFVANFQTSATGTTYNLILHQATTSASAYTVKADNFQVKPSQYVYGTPITDWVAWTPTGSLTTNATYTGMRRRVGGDEEFRIKTAFSGANTQGTMNLNLPVTIDTAKVPGTISGATVFGSGSVRDSGSADFDVSVNYNSTTNVIVLLKVSSATYAYYNPVDTSINAPMTIANGDTVEVFFKVPVVGYSSSVQVSDGYDGRLIAASYALTSNITINTSATDLTGWSSIYDTTASFNAATGVFTLPSSGEYQLDLALRLETGGSAATQHVIEVVGTGSIGTYYVGASSDIAASKAYNYYPSYSFRGKAGDTIKVRVTSATNASTAYGSQTLIAIKKLQSPTTISATAIVAASYRISADKTPSASNPIDYDTKIFDTHNSVTTGSSWKFTAPIAGLYRVTTTNGTSTTGGTLDLYKNGSQDRGLMSMADTSVRSASATVELLAGGYISINPDSASKTFTGTKNNTIYIERIK